MTLPPTPLTPYSTKCMEVDWIVVGWIIDMIFNGIVWLIIVALLIPLIELNDKWIRKAVSFMDIADKWVRKILENSLDWIQKKKRSTRRCFARNYNS